MTEERQPNTEPYWRKCPQCRRENSTKSWAMFGGKCPNCNDLYEKETMSQPNTELREWVHKLLEELEEAHDDFKDVVAERILAAFAASIQAEAQQQIERLEKGIKAFKEYEECAERQIKGLEQQSESLEKQLAKAQQQIEELKKSGYFRHKDECDYWGRAATDDWQGDLPCNCGLDKFQNLKEDKDDWKAIAESRQSRLRAAEKQLAEALKDRDELAAQVNHDCAFHDEMALTNEIHNRFCGENGEPCQVCRLKAEREEKK